MNIYEKIARITAEIETVAKNLEVEINEKKKYKAVAEGDVLRAVKPIEDKYRVCSYPAKREIVETAVMETETKYGVKKNLFVRIKTTYRFVNVDQPEEYIEVVGYGDGVDSQDKASGKAMTYSDKYCLLKAYKIETGDDPDAEPSGDLFSLSSKTMPATEDMKIKFRKRCQELGCDPRDVLKETGWQPGEKMTVDQFYNAMRRLG